MAVECREIFLAGVVGGQTYPGVELTEAWKKALFNQFHDLAAGSGLGLIYKDAEKDYDQVRWTSDEASTTALHSIDARIDTEGRANRRRLESSGLEPRRRRSV